MNKEENYDDYITVTQGMSGHFAIQRTWDKDLGFWDVWTTGFGRYRTSEGAIREAINWAESEGMKYVGPKLSTSVDHS